MRTQRVAVEYPTLVAASPKGNGGGPYFHKWKNLFATERGVGLHFGKI
jgi:hypothetical protein